MRERCRSLGAYPSISKRDTNDRCNIGQWHKTCSRRPRMNRWPGEAARVCKSCGDCGSGSTRSGAYQHICDWAGYREDEARVRGAIKARPSIGTALMLEALSSTPGEQFECARQVAAQLEVPKCVGFRMPARSQSTSPHGGPASESL